MRPVKHLTGEPEQRYWRRRANLRVRKARLARNAGYWSGVIALNLAIASVLVYVGIQGFQRIRNSEEFALDRIEIEGSARSSVEATRARLQPFLGTNLFDLELGKIEALVGRDPWVARASIKRVLPDRLRVTLVERTPCAVALINGIAHVVDQLGYVIGPTGPGMSYDLPVLTGLAGDKATLVGDLRRGVQLLHRLRDVSARFTDNISELDLSMNDRITVRMIQAGPRLLLDPLAVERNVRSYLEIGGGLREQVGQVEYIDLRWRKKISVMPAMQGRQGN